ncbi:MAG TPA: hypothetical protein PLW02_01670 [Verrucomicrobiota bacterium]|nr:hypothetical protein [Verrucomicrobiota bacterium]
MNIDFYNTEDGIHFPEIGLWLDSKQSASDDEIVFVSHSHYDHISKHKEVVLSIPTSRLMKVRSKSKRKEHKLEYFKRTNFKFKDKEFSLTLLPAGHILGSAMLLIEVEGSSILYSGDFKLNSLYAAEKCAPQKADCLIMETTFGKSEYKFPPIKEVEKQIISFCKTTLSEKFTPVLLAYSLGKSQDLLSILAKEDLPILVHTQIHKLTQIYREFGYKFPNYEIFSRRKMKGRVVIYPPSAANIDELFSGKPIKTAAITGWAINKNAGLRVDEAFPLSDHSDFYELIDFVRVVNPKKVFTTHGFASEFAAVLRSLGFDAQPLEKTGQKWLPLSG